MGEDAALLVMPLKGSAPKDDRNCCVGLDEDRESSSGGKFRELAMDNDFLEYFCSFILLRLFCLSVSRRRSNSGVPLLVSRRGVAIRVDTGLTEFWL